MIRALYSVLMTILTPLLVLRLWIKGQQVPAYRERIAERFACFDAPKTGIDIWIHAVSLGEVNTIAPVIKRLLKDPAHYSIAITTMTPTGSSQVKKLFSDKVFHVYIPFEQPMIVRRFLRKLQPKLAVMVETEIWPNLYYFCQRAEIPLVIANARLSHRSFVGYMKIRALIKHTLSAVDKVLVQTKDDGERFLGLGLDKNKCSVTGSLKFDVLMDEAQRMAGISLRERWGDRPVWIVASTHEGEDEICLDALKIVKKTFNDAMLILVPRHPERFDKVALSCVNAGFSVNRRSQNIDDMSGVDVYLADTMGEMSLLYATSDVAVVAGSFITRGGHNVLEPIALNIPVITGPYGENFLEINRLLVDAEGMIQLNTVDELATQVIRLLGDSALRQNYTLNARGVLEKNQGAVDKHIEFITSKLKAANY